MRRLPYSFLTALLFFSLAAQAAPDPAMIAACDGCHGPKGITTSQTTPSLAGISATSLSASLKEFRAKTRPCGAADMCAAAAKLSDADITALADHYSKLPYSSMKQTTDPAKVTAGKAIAAKHCEGCHSKGGSDPADDASILAGQPATWLRSTLSAYKAGKVADGPKMMKQKLATLSDADLDALAQYYASL